MSNGVLTRGKKLKADEAVKIGDLATAKQLYLAVCRTDASDGEAWVKLGEVCRQQGDFVEAETYCRKGVRLRPNIGMAHFALGTALQSQNKNDEAVQCYRTAIQLQPDFAPAHYVLGNILSETGELALAIDALRTALTLRPVFFEALSDLGAIYVALGRDAEAAIVLQKALQIRGNSAEVLGNLGTLAERRSDVEEALRLYSQATSLSPNALDILAKRAELLEKLNRLSEAKATIEAGLGLDAQHPALNLAAARVERREEQISSAITRLRAVLQRSVGRETAIDARLLLGQLEDQAGNAEAALENWTTAKKILALANDPYGEAAERFLNRIEVSNSWFAELRGAGSIQNAPMSTVAPVFLIGFPRSGTTLLEQVLDSHPKLQAVEERPMAAVMERRYLEMQAATGCSLATLSEDQIQTLRDMYFDELKKHIEPEAGLQVVDKLPLNIVLVPLLWRVFPDAKFVLALRHPCDVCLSCLMQNFGHNDAMAGYVDLDRIATIYSQVMRAWIQVADSLPIKWHAVKYEELITNFDATAGAVLEFIEVGWDGAVRDHTGHARQRNLIATPSYHQVTRPIYQSAKYRWMRYRSAFEPLLPRLQPFFDRFGYSV